MFEFSLFFTLESLFTMQEANVFSSQQVSLIILNMFMESKKVVKVDPWSLWGHVNQQDFFNYNLLKPFNEWEFKSCMCMNQVTFEFISSYLAHYNKKINPTCIMHSYWN
jgi:hypothetical protein